MNYLRKGMLFAVIIIATLILPTITAANSENLSTTNFSSLALDSPEIATVESLVNVVDYEGGVSTVVASAQNATEYGYTHTQSLLTIIENQMDSEDGYVSMAVFEAAGLTPFPNGVVGGPVASLQVTVDPIWDVPFDDMDTTLTDLSLSEAINLADEIADHYSSDLGLDLVRFFVYPTSKYFMVYTDSGYHSEFGYEYIITYIALLTGSESETLIGEMLTRFSGMDGFMDICDGPNWPILRTHVSEAFIPSHWTAGHEPYMYGIPYGISMGISYNYVRAHQTHEELQETVQTFVVAEAGFRAPDYVNDSTYSPLEYIGYTDDLTNMQADHPERDSISVIAGIAPSDLTFTGIDDNWMFIDKDYVLPEMMFGGQVHTASDLIMMFLTEQTQYVALNFASSLYIDSTMFDTTIDSIWGGETILPDFNEYLLNLDENDFPMGTEDLISINFDLVAEIMKYAGLTPEVLMNHIDDTLSNTNPLAAIVLGLIDYADAYNLLDILDSTHYGSPDSLADYLNTTIDDLGTMLSDLAGYDIPSDFNSKEAIATFVEDHWDIMLQALWNAMEEYDDNLNPIKNAVYAILDSENIMSHVIPYLHADMGSTFLTGLDFGVAVNIYDLENPIVFSMDEPDFSMSFDLMPDASEATVPFLMVTKTASETNVLVDSEIEFTISVYNPSQEIAYDVKLYDGIHPALGGDRNYYWTTNSLSSGETWTVTYTITADTNGMFVELPAICVYFNTTVDSFNPSNPESWTGSSFYTVSASGKYLRVVDPSNPITFLPSSTTQIVPTTWTATESSTTTSNTTGASFPYGEIFGIPTIYIAVGIGGIAIIVVVIVVLKRR